MTNKNQEQNNSELKRVQRELSVIYDVSNAMRTTLDLKHILYIILTGVTSHTGLGFNRAALFLVNKTERYLEPKMAISPESGEEADKIWKYIRESEQDLEDLIAKDRVYSGATSSKLFQTIKDLKIPLDPQDKDLISRAYHQGVPIL